MRDLSTFNRRLATTFGAGYVAGYDANAGRYYVDTPTVTGRTVRQFWAWFVDAQGMPIEPHPETGLHPFRDLDESAQEVIVRNLHQSNIGVTGYGDKDWGDQIAANLAENRSIARGRRRQRAQDWADMVSSMDIRRPGWLKEHQPSNRKVYV